MLTIKRLDHLTITSRAPAKSIAFYKHVLGMKPAYEWPGEVTMLQAGDTHIAIAWWNQGKDLCPQPEIAVDHFAFQVDPETFELARTRLPELGYPIDHLSDHGICHSLYVRDPDHHLVELVCYELKGAANRMPLVLSK